MSESDLIGDKSRRGHWTAGDYLVFAAEARLWRAVLEAVLASPAIEAQWIEHRLRFHENLASRFRRLR